MEAEVLFAFPSAREAYNFVTAENIEVYTYKHPRCVLRCLCTRNEAEASVNLFNGTLLDASPMRLKAGITKPLANIS